MGVGVGIAGVGTAIGLGLWEMAKHAAEGGAALAEMSERTGMSVESLSAFKGIVLQAGLAMEDFEIAIKKMQKAAFGDAAAKTFAKLGIAADDFQKMDPHEQLIMVAEALHSVDNDGKRAALSLEIFGKAGSKMLNVLAGGSEEVQEMLHQMEELGLVMSGDAAEGAKKMHRSMVLLQMVNSKIAETIGSVLIPVITSLNKMDISSHGNILKTVQANKGWVIAIALVATGMVVLGGTIIATGAVFSSFGVIIGSVAKTATAAFSIFKSFGVLMVAMASSTGMLVLAWAILGVAVAGFAVQIILSTERGRKAFSSMGKTFGDVKEDIVTGWNGIVAALKQGDIATAATIGMKLIGVEWARMIASMKTDWYDLINSLSNVWSNWSAKIAEGFFNLEALLLKQQFPDMQEKIERNRKAQIGDVIDQTEINKAAAVKERDDKVEKLTEEIEKLRAGLVKAADPANIKGLGGGKDKPGGGGIPELGKATAFGQYGGQNLNQLFGPGADGGNAAPHVKAVIEVRKEVAKVHAVNIQMFGVAKAQLEWMKANGQPFQTMEP